MAVAAATMRPAGRGLLLVAAVAVAVCAGVGQATDPSAPTAPTDVSGPVRIPLDGSGPGSLWTLRNANGSVALAHVAVPGQVQLALLNASVIPDPYFRTEDVATQWVSMDTWTYSRSFEPPAAPAGARILLVCDGLDTVATVGINGAQVGTSTNQFRRATFDVTGSLKPTGTNTVTITFLSAVQYAAAQAAAYPLPVPHAQFQNGLNNANFVRKRPSDFGWDWGPAVAPVGIWKSLALVVVPHLRITHLAVQVVRENPGHAEELPSGASWAEKAARPIAADEGFVVSVAVHYACEGAPLPGPAGWETRIEGLPTVATPRPTVECNATAARFNFTVPSKLVQLWYPNGLGAQPLYTLEVAANQSGGSPATYDAASRRIGFRDLRVDTTRSPDGGRGFFFRVNGIPVFSKGASYVPTDALTGRVSPARYQRLMQSAVEANYNTIRVWGGGDYLPEAFWDLADSMGIMIWLDFQFASALYPRDDAFVREVEAEVRHQTRRLTGHPSLALFCGNNEGFVDTVRSAAPGANFQNISQVYTLGYAALFDQVLRRALAEENPSVSFHASSPSNGALVDDLERGLYIHNAGDAFSPDFGDTRHYDYTDDCTDITQFPRGKFIGEYGWQSYPSLVTLQQATLPEDWSNDSPVMKARQHHPNGNAQLVQQIERFFRLPNLPDQKHNFSAFVYLSQVVQTLCIGVETQFYRTLRSDQQARTMGTLYWQFNDVWQAQSWASVEYGEEPRWKMLHYAAKRAYDPLVVVPFLTAGSRAGAGSRATNKTTVEVWGVNDENGALPASLELAVHSWAGKQLSQHAYNVTLPSQGSALLTSAAVDVLIQPHSRAEVFVSVRLVATHKTVASHLFLVPLKDVGLPVATVAVKVLPGGSRDRSGATVSSARVQLDVTGGVAPYTMVTTTVPGRWSDNGVLLIPGQPRVLEFTGWSPFSESAFAGTISTQTVRGTYTAHDGER